MRKGNKDGLLTYKQLLDEIARLRKENSKLKNELYSRTVAFNKLLKQTKGENE